MKEQEEQEQDYKDVEARAAAILTLKKNIVPNFNLGDLLGPLNKILSVKNAPHLVYQFFRHLS